LAEVPRDPQRILEVGTRARRVPEQQEALAVVDLRDAFAAAVADFAAAREVTPRVGERLLVPAERLRERSEVTDCATRANAARAASRSSGLPPAGPGSPFRRAAKPETSPGVDRRWCASASSTFSSPK